MILSLAAISIIVAFIGLRYLLHAATATYAHERDEAIDDAISMGIIIRDHRNAGLSRGICGGGEIAMYNFSSGILQSPNNIKFGTLENVTIEETATIKELSGRPASIARGAIKTTGKAKVARISGHQFSDIRDDVTSSFQVICDTLFQGQSISLKLNNCTSNKLSVRQKREDFTMPDFEFSCFPDRNGNVMTWSFTDDTKG